MKIKFMPFSRSKRVIYFEHRNGVVNDKSGSRFNMFFGFMATVLVFGGGGFAVTKYIDLRYEEQGSTISLQRQSMPADTRAQANETDDKLKNASTKAREDEQLAKQIKSKLKNTPGGQKWSVYVRDLNSDRMASINADKELEAGGLANLFITAPLEGKIPSNKWVWRYGKQPLDKCVQEMISAGDADCTRLIKRYADLKNAGGVFAGLGLKKTEINDKEQKTTAREMGDLMFRLQNSQILSDKGRRAVFDGLYGQRERDGIPDGCDEGCLIANITAEGESLRHDAAIVTSGDTKYVVVIMTQGANWGQIADVAAEIRLALQP